MSFFKDFVSVCLIGLGTSAVIGNFILIVLLEVDGISLVEAVLAVGSLIAGAILLDIKGDK